MPLAAKLMARMGWEQGKGLGKELQGTTLPLVAKKTSARAAVVVPAAAEEEQMTKEEEKKTGEAKGVPLASSPPSPSPFSSSWPGEGDDASRVVLLTNVAPPGLPEKELGRFEDEVGMAATASGGLRSVSVFEVTERSSSSSSSPSYPKEALVRVFVEFGSAAEAGRVAGGVRGQRPSLFLSDDRAKARFGGGVIVARPFSLERLRQGRLAPEPGDVP